MIPTDVIHRKYETTWTNCTTSATGSYHDEWMDEPVTVYLPPVSVAELVRTYAKLAEFTKALGDTSRRKKPPVPQSRFCGLRVPQRTAHRQIARRKKRF